MDRTALLVEEARRQKSKDTRQRDTRRAQAILAKLFKEQKDFVLDKSRFKASLCPRRAGKSFAVLAYALIVSLLRPGAKVLVLARVRRQARGVYWHALQQILTEHEVKPRALRNMMLECELDNGSLIQFAGADTAEEIDKYRGQGYDLVCIDECKSYSPSLLQELIDEIITPALLDRQGSLVLIGTPGPIPNGLFWAVTTRQPKFVPPGGDAEQPEFLRVRLWAEREQWEGPVTWSLHRWTAKDNTYCPWIWQGALEIKAQKGYADDHPVWLREYCGEWIPDHDSLVYALHKAEDRVVWSELDKDGPHGLPSGHEWRFILGVDLGFKDATAFVVAAWSQTHPKLHYLRAERYSGYTAEEVATRTRELEEIYGKFDAKIADCGGLGQFAVQGIARSYGIHFEAAKKTDKRGHIALLNSDLLTGRLAVYEIGAAQLLEEWRTLQWADREKGVEDSGCDNHASDAALYVWRYAYHHWAKEKTRGPEPGTTDWWLQLERNEKAKAAAQIRQAKQPWWKQQRTNKLPDSAEVVCSLANWKS